jgi:hypothetical protein
MNTKRTAKYIVENLEGEIARQYNVQRSCWVKYVEHEKHMHYCPENSSSQEFQQEVAKLHEAWAVACGKYEVLRDVYHMMTGLFISAPVEVIG